MWGLQLEDRRSHLNEEGNEIALCHLNCMQVIVNPKSLGHSKATDEFFESTGIKGTKQLDRRTHKATNFESMSQEFMDYGRRRESKESFESFVSSTTSPRINEGTMTLKNAFFSINN